MWLRRSSKRLILQNYSTTMFSLAIICNISAGQWKIQKLWTHYCRCTFFPQLRRVFWWYFRYFAGGSDDGTVYLYDMRKPCSAYVTRLMGGSEKHTNMANGYNRSPITDVTFHTMKSNVLLAATLNGELIKFE